MCRALVFASTLALAAVFTPDALAGARASVTALELTAGPARTLSAGGTDLRFTLVGLHWRGPGRIVFRTRSLEGGWNPWRPAAPEDEDGPDRGSREAQLRAGWRIGNPWWVGPSDRVEARSIGRIARVRAYLVWSPEVRIPYRAPAAAEAPPVVPRLSWGADESIRRRAPSYAPDVRFAVVHHTAGRNDYTRAAAPAIVKAIQLYHVQGNGWNDIGYNFLVDRFGTVYEGRFGGVDRNVVGAHALGFNTGSVGIALVGTYGTTAPSRAAQDAIARLVAWRLDLAHVDPTGLLTVLSGGNERYASGIPVPLRTVSGHRDTGFTECPGNALYAQLNALAAKARGTGLPKIFDPRVETNDAGFRFTARLSASLPWSVVLKDGAGTEIARGAGSGATVDWTWDGSAVPAGTYSWSIAAGAARPATGSVRAGGTVTVAIEEVSADPAAISPNGDGQADSALVTYRLTAAANVTVEVVDESGELVATVVDRVWTRAGRHTVVVDGAELADGSYGVVITARTAVGAEVQTVVPVVVNRTLGTVGVAPAVFSPNEDGRKDRLTVTFSLAAPADATVRIVREGRWVATPLAASLLPGTHRLVWNGRRASGQLRDGSYAAVVESRDASGTISFGLPFVSDTVAPRVRILPGRELRVEVSEPAALRIRIDGKAVRRAVKRAGVARIPGTAEASRVRIVASDEAGNVSAPVMRVARPGTSRWGQ